jgi:ATP-dependent Clp protease ATP-binding subunit ClpC
MSEEARAWLLKVGYDPAYGARPLRRAMERYLENPLASLLLEGKFAEGDTVMVDREGSGLTFAPAVHKTSRCKSRTAKPAPKR